MEAIPWAIIIIFVLIVAGFVISVPAFKAKQKAFKETGKHPKGHYVGLGMAIGIPLGMPIGIAMGNIALGIPLGLPIGLAIGMAWEKMHEKDLRPLTPEEEKMKQRGIMLGIGMLVLGLVALVGFYFLAR